MSSRWSFALALCLGVLVFSHADADHHKKKNKDSAAELTQCTIVGPNDAFSCSGQKRVCQKLKNGKKCCGCVADENAKASQPDKTTTQGQAPTTTPTGQQVKHYCRDTVTSAPSAVAKFKTECEQGGGSASCTTPSVTGQCCCQLP